MRQQPRRQLQRLLPLHCLPLAAAPREGIVVDDADHGHIGGDLESDARWLVGWLTGWRLHGFGLCVGLLGRLFSNRGDLMHFQNNDCVCVCVCVFASWFVCGWLAGLLGC